MADLKGLYQERAYEIVADRYGGDKEFYDLPDEEQTKIYKEAERDVTDRLVSQYESREDR